jgi:hypothetical protein
VGETTPIVHLYYQCFVFDFRRAERKAKNDEIRKKYGKEIGVD